MRFADRRQTRGANFAVQPPQPTLCRLMHRIERSHLYQHIRDRRKLAVHKLKIPQRSQK